MYPVEKRSMMTEGATVALLPVPNLRLGLHAAQHVVLSFLSRSLRALKGACHRSRIDRSGELIRCELRKLGGGLPCLRLGHVGSPTRTLASPDPLFKESGCASLPPDFEHGDLSGFGPMDDVVADDPQEPSNTPAPRLISAPKPASRAAVTSKNTGPRIIAARTDPP